MSHQFEDRYIDQVLGTQLVNAYGMTILVYLPPEDLWGTVTFPSLQQFIPRRVRGACRRS
jgi:hypothetical protein